jgi:hypothetical protein
MPNQIKIKSSPPLSTEFSPTDLVVDIKNGHLYFKSNVRIHKLTDAKDLSDVTTELGSQIQVLASLSASHAALTFSTLTHDAPTGSGFYLDDSHLGYYSGSEWYTFMSSSGNFYLGGELGGLVWNHDANTLSVAGHVQAYSGTVGGFTIGLTSLSSSNFIINTFDSKILLGNPSSSNVFIVDADTGMHLGNPDFASAPFSVTKGGALKSTSGEIGGFTIGVGGLTAQNFELLTAEKSLTLGAGNSIFIADGDEGIHLGNATFANAPFSVTLGGSLTATLGQIAGWNIDNEKMSNTGVHLSSSYGLKVFDGVDDGLDFVEMKYKASDNWGLVGKESGQEIFQLGNQNQIAGWSFDQNKIISNYGVNSPTNPGIVIKSEGTIETDPFISGLTANATGWQIRADGRAEFENAVIRGTLSTAVFEKDTISVVGGQVMIANAAKVDNVNPRFTDYPYLKSAIGENINWSGEQSPITGSSIRSSSLFLNNIGVTSSFATSQNLWLKFSNKSALYGEAKFSIGTGSYAPGTKFRLSLYSSGSVKSGTYRQPKFQLHTNNSTSYVPQFSLNGGILVSTFQTLLDGLNIIEFSSSADWNANSTHNGGTTLHFSQGHNMNAIGDSFYLRDIHCMALSQSLIVDNAGGFVKGEYLVAKSTDQGPDGREGFVREYMQVISSSLGSPDTPASGTFDFSNATINTATNIFVTASKKYTFTGVTSPTIDQVADNQYYFVLGTNPNTTQGKQKSLINLKDKIVEEVLDIFAMTTGSQPGVLNQIYFQGHGVGIDGNAYGVQSGSTQVTLQGGINRTKPTLTVERNLDARVSGNERGYWIDRIKDGQSMASQGAAGTGYILLNAQPTDDYTPYIDIVERQDTTVGSQQHTGNDKNSVFGEVTTLARIGDLSGITDYNFSDGVSGYGIYTSNGYFKGKVEVSSLPITPPSENLIFHLPLDGKVLSGSQGSGSFPDLSGNNYHNNNNYVAINGDWAGTSVTVNSASAKIGGSAVFTATAGDANRLIYKNIPLRDNHTFSAWVKIDDSNTSQMLFAIDANSSYTNPFTGGNLNPGTGGVGADGQLDFFFHTNTIYWNSGDSVSNPFRTLGNTANVTWQQYDNTWTHFAVVNNSSTLSASLYINGKLEGYAAYRNPTTNAGVGDLTVGGYVYSSATNHNFKGEIDDFRIYTGSLSSNQIESIYLSPDSGTGRTIISGDSISSGHLRSNNWGPSFGSEYNLNEGTFKLGGSTDPKLSWNGSQLVVKGQIQIEAGSTLPNGATVTSLASCVISSDTQIFAFADSNDTTPTPSTATITVQQANQLSDIVSGDITVTNGTKSNFIHAPGTSTGTGTATFTVTPSGTYPVTVTVTNDGITDTITLHKVQGGTNAYTVILSNEAHTLAAPISGIVSSGGYAGSGTTISVYKGTTELNSIATGTPTSGQFKVTATGTGIAPSIVISVANNPTVFGDASTMSANNASISFAVNIENVTTITKVQSFAKSTAGTNGNDGIDGIDGTNGLTGPAGPNFSFLTGSLSQVTPPIAAGLLMTDNVFGYHTGITVNETTNAAKLNKFTSLLDNSGNFYLGSGSGAGHLTWQNDTSVLTVSGTINATAGNIGGFGIKKGVLSGSGFSISGSSTGNQFFISSSKFNVKANGDITASALRLQDANGYVNYNSQAGTFDGMTNLRFIGELNGPLQSRAKKGMDEFPVELYPTPYMFYNLQSSTTTTHYSTNIYSIGGRNSDDVDRPIWSTPFFTFPQEEWLIIQYCGGLSWNNANGTNHSSNNFKIFPRIKYVNTTTALTGTSLYDAYETITSKPLPDITYDGELYFQSASNALGAGLYYSANVHRPGYYALRLYGNGPSQPNYSSAPYNLQNKQMILSFVFSFQQKTKNTSNASKKSMAILDGIRIYACTNKAKENLLASLSSAYTSNNFSYSQCLEYITTPTVNVFTPGANDSYV